MASTVMATEWCGPAVVVSAAGFRPNEADRARAWELVSAAQSGDQDAFGVLWTRYVRAVRGVVRGWVQDSATAEDVTSETFLKALRSLEHARDKGVDVLGWLLWLAHGLVLNHRDRGCVRREIPVGEFRDEDAGVSEFGDPERVVLWRLDQAAITTAVQAAVAGLPVAQRMVVRMCDLDERPTGEVATTLGRTESAVRTLRWRGRQGVAAVLAPWAPPERERAVAIDRARTAQARATRRVVPAQAVSALPGDVKVLAGVERVPSTVKPFRARVRWLDPATRVRRSLSHSCASYEEAAAWLHQMMQHQTGTVCTDAPASPDQVDAVESATGWVVAA